MTNRRVASGGARRVVLGAALAAGWLGAVLMAPAAGDAAPAGGPPAIGNCPIFPADNVWNARIDHLQVHARSDAWIASIGASTGLHPDFGSGIDNGAPIGIPYSTAPGSQPEVEITFDDAEESDPGPYRLPFNANIEGGDHHVLIVDRERCLLTEIYGAAKLSPTSWSAGSGAIFNLHSNDLRPAGWTSADAAGLPILPGLARYDEIEAGEIAHALRFTAARTQKAYIWPARHYASEDTDPDLPPMGARVRLKADVNVSGYAPEVQIILTALQRYGMLLADNGSDWFVTGTPDSRWNNDNLRQLRNVVGSNLEFVDASSLMVHPDSGQVARVADDYVTRVRFVQDGAGTARYDEYMSENALRALPNIGPAIAKKLIRLGIEQPDDLRGQDPEQLFRRLCDLDGRRHDPCLLDTFVAAVDHANGAPPRPWWYYSRQRKAGAASQT